MQAPIIAKGATNPYGTAAAPDFNTVAPICTGCGAAAPSKFGDKPPTVDKGGTVGIQLSGPHPLASWVYDHKTGAFYCGAPCVAPGFVADGEAHLPDEKKKAKWW